MNCNTFRIGKVLQARGGKLRNGPVDVYLSYIVHLLGM